MVISHEYEKQVFQQKLDEFASLDAPIDKILDARALQKSIDSIILNYVIDTFGSSILPDIAPYALLGNDVKFSVVLKGIQGRMNPLKGHSLSLEIIEKPSGSIPTITTQESEAQINLTFKTDKDGVYTFRAHSFGKDIKGSPVKVNIYPLIDEVFDAPEKINTGGGFNPVVKEIWIKGKEKIHSFNMKGVPIRVIDLPIQTLSFDDEGFIYGADFDKHFYRYDRNTREKWSVYPAEGKITSACCSDGTIVYGVYKTGPLLLLNRETGFTIEIIEIPDLENVTSLIAWEDFLMICDNGNVKIFSKKGKLLKCPEELKNIQSMSVINRMVYACKEKSNTWYKIITPKSLKENQELLKNSKLSKYPSIILSPRLLDSQIESVSLTKQGSSFGKKTKK